MPSLLRWFAVGLLLLAVGGCSQFPESYRRIQVGKPLDCSVLPNHVRVRVAGFSQVQLEEDRQLPLGFERWSLDIDLDHDWNVESVRMHKSTVWYLVVVLVGLDEDWSRGLDGESTRPPSPCCIPIICPLVWVMYGLAPLEALGGAGIGFELFGHPTDARKLHVGPEEIRKAASQPSS
jgi:hypothetical protein